MSGNGVYYHGPLKYFNLKLAKEDNIWHTYTSLDSIHVLVISHNKPKTCSNISCLLELKVQQSPDTLMANNIEF